MSIRNVVLAVVVIVSLAIPIVSLLYYFVYQKIMVFTLSIHFVQNLRKLFPVIIRKSERQNIPGEQGASRQGVIKELDDLTERCERPVFLFHRLMFSYCEGALVIWRQPCLHSNRQCSPGTLQMFVQQCSWRIRVLVNWEINSSKCLYDGLIAPDLTKDTPRSESRNSAGGEKTADEKTFDPKNTVLKNCYECGQDVSRI